MYAGVIPESDCAHLPAVTIHMNMNAWIHMQQRPGHIQYSPDHRNTVCVAWFEQDTCIRTRKNMLWLSKKKEKRRESKSYVYYGRLLDGEEHTV